MLGACCAGRGNILRANQVSSDLHQIPDTHSGVGKDRDNLPPAGLSLRLDTLGHRSIRQHADFAGDVEKPRALRHLDGMAVGAERRGHRSWGVADIHLSDPFNCRGFRRHD